MKLHLSQKEKQLQGVFTRTEIIPYVRFPFLVTVSPLVIAYEKTVDYNGYKYRYVVTPTHTSVHWVRFYRAQQECVKWGGNLTSIHSQQEFNFIKVHFNFFILRFKFW